MSLKLPGQQKQRPYNAGSNQQKRLAARADRRDRAAILTAFGNGAAKKTEHHQLIVRSRHATYRAAAATSHPTSSTINPEQSV